ncbi:hypothetical protein MMC11_002558 [Xylographa trunciseda]|nr:hypothetical protein [Xylographa trunciseda]
MSEKRELSKSRAMAAVHGPLSALHKKVQRSVSKAKCTGKQIVRAIYPPLPLTPKYWQRRRAISEISTRISTSRLLKLPTEVRQMILTLVLGNRVLRLSYEDRWRRHRIRLGHCCIRLPSEGVKVDATREAVPYHGRSGWCQDVSGLIFTTRGSESIRPLALLRTCRTIYIETIHIIYSTNIIDLDFYDFAELNFWTSSIGPLRLAAITSLQLHCDVPFGLHRNTSTGPGLVYDMLAFELWEEVWKIVAEQMTSLRTLVVRMFMFVRLRPAIERELLRSFAEIKGLKYLSVRRIISKRHNLRSEEMCSQRFLDQIVTSPRDRSLMSEKPMRSSSRFEVHFL